VIDTDPAISIFGADVDDALAIFLALNSDEIEVDGITTVFGNTNVDATFRIANEILSVAGRTNIPVYKGAYNATWLGVRTKAVQYLIDQIMEHPGEITLVTLAPLTNVATAFLLEPRLIENLKAILMMGGLFFRSNSKVPFLQSEFNFSRDSRATKMVLEKYIDTTIVGLDLTTQVVFKDENFRALQRANTPITKYITKHTKSWLALNKLLMSGGFNPHDPIAIAYLLQKSLFKLVKGTVEVQVSKRKLQQNLGHKRYSNSLFSAIGTMLAKDGALKVSTPPLDYRTHKIKICTKINENGFLNLLIERLSRKF